MTTKKKQGYIMCSYKHDDDMYYATDRKGKSGWYYTHTFYSKDTWNNPTRNLRECSKAYELGKDSSVCFPLELLY